LGTRRCPRSTTSDGKALPPLPTAFPVPRRRAPWRRALGIWRNDLISLIPEDAFERDAIELQVLWRRYLLLNDPDAVQHVLHDHADRYMRNPVVQRIFKRVLGDSLITTEGDTWRRHRQALAPAFTPKRIRRHAPVMSETIADFLGDWADLRDGTAVDLVAALRQLTLTIVARTMFSTGSPDDVAMVRESIPPYVRGMQPGIVDLLSDLLPWLPIGRPRRMLPGLDATVEGLVARRRTAREGTADDVLALLLAGRGQPIGRGMTSREVTDHAAHIFIAGHETTEQTLVWTWYLLSQHAAEEATLHAELDRVLAGRLPTVADLPALPYTRMVMEEAMRLYPPAHTLMRQALVDDEVLGRQLPKGSHVLIVPWVLHRHRRLWDRAETFDPERFAPDRAPGHHPFAYIPFGAGPRICLGAQFGMMEAMLVLAGVAQHYRLRLAPGQRVEPLGSVTLRPRYGMTMTLERRLPGAKHDRADRQGS
jgi:cytochrome P450